MDNLLTPEEEAHLEDPNYNMSDAELDAINAKLDIMSKVQSDRTAELFKESAEIDKRMATVRPPSVLYRILWGVKMAIGAWALAGILGLRDDKSKIR